MAEKPDIGADIYEIFNGNGNGSTPSAVSDFGHERWKEFELEAEPIANYRRQHLAEAAGIIAAAGKPESLTAFYNNRKNARHFLGAVATGGTIKPNVHLPGAELDKPLVIEPKSTTLSLDRDDNGINYLVLSQVDAKKPSEPTTIAKLDLTESFTKADKSKSANRLPTTHRLIIV